MRIYTRSGDKGTTSLVYGTRVAKNDIRVEAYGTCDEANSLIGVAISHMQAEEFDGKCKFIKALQRVQTILFHVGSELATPTDKEVAWKLTQAHIDELEQQIDAWDASLPELKNFILPSGTLASTTLHTARTVVRRAERAAVAIGEEEKHRLAISYLNRLSDFLFVAARYVNVKTGGTELPLQVD
ncbi:cob(I)yrinic acid a,c-diamide adenosyltransferase [Radiobacillus kanasensis]|uniref:cob(I)yrinic acid a,c-diamide adenosyltransferase n=1 Tax=Radiobacillus kanasensis TaxID=2844358 RepID=UPI001E4DB4D1|nr:cob(I)yrinic acid a,c-diamide adenosyltransferase [Radiobacillus kanasensis]UFU00159.1 cob(I)yrinic acid a,c-diamide adenosyltransferase [Radiobacillus kanasensis]